MNAAKLHEIKQRHGKATKGKWLGVGTHLDDGFCSVAIQVEGYKHWQNASGADLEFIRHAHEDVPDLVTALVHSHDIVNALCEATGELVGAVCNLDTWEIDDPDGPDLDKALVRAQDALTSAFRAKMLAESERRDGLERRVRELETQLTTAKGCAETVYTVLQAAIAGTETGSPSRKDLLAACSTMLAGIERALQTLKLGVGM